MAAFADMRQPPKKKKKNSCLFHVTNPGKINAINRTLWRKQIHVPDTASLGFKTWSGCYVFALSDNHRMCYLYHCIMVSVLLEVFSFLFHM